MNKFIYHIDVDEGRAEYMVVAENKVNALDYVDSVDHAGRVFDVKKIGVVTADVYDGMELGIICKQGCEDG